MPHTITSKAFKTVTARDIQNISSVKGKNKDGFNFRFIYLHLFIHLCYWVNQTTSVWQRQHTEAQQEAVVVVVISLRSCFKYQI